MRFFWSPKMGEHLLGAFPDVGSFGERRKLWKELEKGSGSVFHSDGTVELVMRRWSKLPALRGMQRCPEERGLCVVVPAPLSHLLLAACVGAGRAIVVVPQISSSSFSFEVFAFWIQQFFWMRRACFPSGDVPLSWFFSPVVQVVFWQGESGEHPHAPSPVRVL